ncbi:(d)CMP kinase [Pararobbsia silviterrae]|uniref:Cytidylate kinase n=1 Tax=Pararobbsia silviterrae TaxID=1792498 RepID=A0A494YEU6_9BURK|nr:(d)CMP kinase [Pararobbsia silviterrae]RKP59248.1 (d)CMP kinase [Pararobbsia silviterrae]
MSANLKVPVITIDGPTASGKGTVAQQVADALGFHYLDSGALYRLTALASLKIGIDENDVDTLVELAQDIHIVFREGCVRLDGEDVSLDIRAESVGNRASAIAVHGALRQALIARQRAFRVPPGLVADGRDMGTVIFPDASLKVFLTASVEARADRRYKQLIEKGFSAKLDDLSRDLRARDDRDSQRAAAPLKPADDALTLDTSNLDVDQTVQTVVGWFRERMQNK